VAAVPRRAELNHLLARARQVFDGLARGGHAAAERMLRETAAALARRGDPAAACVVHTWLCRLLIERGRPADAVRVVDAAAVPATLVTGAACHALAWRAWALADLAHLQAAESACLDVLRREPPNGRPALVWTRSVLVRLYLA
jgi:hypothetical protein